VGNASETLRPPMVGLGGRPIHATPSHALECPLMPNLSGELQEPRVKLSR
jgi:hypothetical protein